jgi:hypothetical protein
MALADLHSRTTSSNTNLMPLRLALTLATGDTVIFAEMTAMTTKLVCKSPRYDSQ